MSLQNESTIHTEIKNYNFEMKENRKVGGIAQGQPSKILRA